MTSRPRKKRAREPWGEFEDLAIREFYPRHGPSWDGWAEVLPGRTHKAIVYRAGKLDLRMDVLRPRKEDEQGTVPNPDEYERTVTRLMRQGLTPSQIDSQEHWVPGTTLAILTNRWKG